jgi:hypothetical protein
LIKTNLLIIISLLIPTLIISIIPEVKGEGGPFPIPIISIDFDRDSYTSCVEPGISDRTTIITGELHCVLPRTIPNGIDCTVVLLIETRFMEVSGETEFIFNKSKETERLLFEVVVEEGLSVYRSIGLTIYGIWEYDKGYGDGEINPAYCKIKANPYGSVDLSLPQGMGRKIEIKEGNEEEEVIWIRNLGNSDDTFEVTIETKLEGVRVRSLRRYVNITSGETQKISINIQADEGAEGSGLITINTRSGYSGLNNEDSIDYTLIVVQKEEEAFNIMLVGTIMVLLFGLILLIIIGIVTRFKMKDQGK